MRFRDHFSRVDRSVQTDTRAKLVRPEVGIARDALNAPRVGEIFLSADELGGRVSELGAQIAADYADRDLLLVALLKSSFIFVADLSRVGGQAQLDVVAAYHVYTDAQPLAALRPRP